MPMVPPSHVAKLTSAAAKGGTSPGLHPTENNLPVATRQAMVALLQARLADAVDLLMQCKQAHWTVKGPQFSALHPLFDQLHGAMRGHMDLIAERAASLGGQVNGTVQGAAGQSSLPAYPVATRKGLDHVAALGHAFAAFAAQLRRGIDLATQAGDAVSADALTQIASDLDKQLWMLEAHKEN